MHAAALHQASCHASARGPQSQPRDLARIAWLRCPHTRTQVVVRETRQPLYKFLTTLCAIIGGVFTVAGILDSLVYTTLGMAKKMELGKQF